MNKNEIFIGGARYNVPREVKQEFERLRNRLDSAEGWISLLGNYAEEHLLKMEGRWPEPEVPF